MAPSSKPTSQKEYLKKYLNKKKKKKPRHSSHRENVKLIDDDAANQVEPLFDSEDEEDAPVIAGFYDERPTDVKLLENYRNLNRWQPVPSAVKEFDDECSSPSLKRQRGRHVEDYHSPSAGRRERHDEDPYCRKRKQQIHTASPTRSKHRTESSPSMRSVSRDDRRIEKRVNHSPSRRGDRAILEDRRLDSDLGERYCENEHSPWRTNRYNGAGSGGGGESERYRHEEPIREERHYRSRPEQYRRRSVDSGSPPRRQRQDADEPRASMLRFGNARQSPAYAERERGRSGRHLSPPARREEWTDDHRRERAAADHRFRSPLPPPPLSKSQKSRRISDVESPPPPPPRSSSRHRSERSDDRASSRTSSRRRPSPLQLPSRNERRPSPLRRANLDDRPRRRSFTPEPAARRRHPPYDGRRVQRADEREPPPRNERHLREEAMSPIPLRKDGRRGDDSRSPSPPPPPPRPRDHRRHDEREPRDVRDARDDVRDARDWDRVREPRERRDGRETRDLRDGRSDGRPAAKEVHRGDLRETLRAARDGRETVRIIEWKEKSSNVSYETAAPASSRRAPAVQQSPPPSRRASPPPPRYVESSSTVARKRKNDAAVTGSASRVDAPDNRRRAGDRRPSTPPPQSPPLAQSSKRCASRYESPSASPKRREAASKYRGGSEQRSQPQRRESAEREYRGRRAGGERVDAASAPNLARNHDGGAEKRHGEGSSSSKMAKERDREPEKGHNSSRLKEENFGLISHKKSSSKPDEKLSDEQSGKHAATIYRDRKTGQKRDLHAEKLQKIEKRRRDDEKKEQYYEWGRGLKQVEEEKAQMQEQLYEMSKPLARYADDSDLDKTLQQKEISGLDPMLAYIHRKKRKKETKDGAVTKPTYKGSWPPNRFNIPPGHKWDGVDRSNGYEGRYFAKQNDTKAKEEEAYKWCSEDM